MEFRILGPLEMCEGDRVIPVGGPRQRALLAFLLLHANEVVASEQLLDGLWGDDPPASGTAALQVRISQLRRTLEQVEGQADAPRLVTRPPGYILLIEESQLDAARFERLLREGKAALARREPAAAAATLASALELWRGAALADLAAEPFARAHSGRLDELRLAALEARIEAELALGLQADLVAELEALVREHPVREAMRRLLMLALYRTGRQADALACYREGREVLVETLGLEPGETLRQLEAAILRQDPDLAAPVVESRPPPPAPARPVGERKVVTVLFADVVGSTELVAGRDPEEARVLLDRLFDAVAAEIEEAGGTVEKFIGDAVMAVFGAPVAQEDHAERALHAALALLRRTRELFAGAVSLGIGVATGEVVVGKERNGGSLVTGTVVNVGARLEQAAGAGEILAHARTAQGARGAFEFGPERSVEGKGIAGGIPCRPLVRALALTRSRGIGGAAPVFVARDDELELLRATYRRVAADRRPALVTIAGEAGVGKSALARHFWEWLPSQQPEPLRRSGQCLSYGRAVTYRPLGDVLREELGLLATDSREAVLERLGGRAILGLALDLDVAPELHPLTAHGELRDALIDFFTALVAERPAAVLIEDLHWAEEPLLELLERLVQEVPGPLLIVGTARPELAATSPGWGAGTRNAVTIGLDPLRPADAELLIDELTDGILPRTLSAQLAARAEGNPFFTEELLATVLERGGVAQRPAPAAAELDELAIPDSLHGVLAARIDLLPPAEKEALQAAAVIGRTFWRGAVRELVEGAPPDFATLERRDFVRRRSTSSIADEREFVFKHALTRDVAYLSVPRARRAPLHAAFAEWLERIGDGREEHAAPLAHHYAESVRAEDAELAWPHDAPRRDELRRKALAWLARAAELAVGRYEIDEALALLSRALELETRPQAVCDLWRAVGRANALKFDGQAFWTAMETAMEHAPDDDTWAEIAGELALQSFVRAGMWTASPPVDDVGGWIARALDLAAPGSPARARALVARAFLDLEDEQAALDAAAAAEELDDPELRVHAWDARAGIAMAAGDYETAWYWRTRRLELLDTVDDPDLRTIIAEMPFPACIATGRFEQAREIARLHERLTAPLTPHHRMHGVAILGEVEELLGGWDAIAALEERVAEAVAENERTPCMRNARSLLVCALAAECLGDSAHAAKLERAADDLELFGKHVLDTPRLRLALLRGDRVRSEMLLAKLLEEGGWYARGHGTSLSTLTARIDGLSILGYREQTEQEAGRLLRPGTYLEPFALRALGRVRDDSELIDRAAACFGALGLHWHAEETKQPALR